MKPITREEQYLNKLTGEEQSIAEPITREEQYLSRLCGADNIIPQTPETRREAYLAALCGEEVETPEPVTRIEQYMNFAAGKSQSKPEKAITREEMYWDKYQGGAVPEGKTVQGDIIHITDATGDNAVALSVALTPTQDGTPWISDTLNTEPYLSRAAQNGNTADETIVGGTVAWNQLTRQTTTGNFATENCTIASGGTYEIIVTYSGSGNQSVYQTALANAFTIESGHKVLAIATIKPNADVNEFYYKFEDYNGTGTPFSSPYLSASANVKTQVGTIVNFTTKFTRLRYKLYLSQTTTITAISNVMLIDLTKMFGSTIADYVYTLEQAEAGSGIAWLKSYGFFTEEYYAYNPGELISAKPTAKVVGDTTYALGGADLRGLFKLDSNNNLYCDGDVYTSDGTITRKYGIVDLGTLNYSYWNDMFLATVSDKKVGRNECVSSIYTFNGNVPDWSSLKDKEITGGLNNHNIYIKNSAYTDTATFKTAMSGVYLVYELATPTTEASTAYTNPQKAGEAEAFVDARTEKVPVGHSTRYSAEYDINGFEGVTVHVSETQTGGTTYPVTFTSQGTVYGGTIDVVSGEMSITYAIEDLGNLEWTYKIVPPLGNIFQAPLTSDYTATSYVMAYAKANNPPSMPFGTYLLDSYGLAIRDPRTQDATEFTRLVTGQKIVYKLATPITATIDPTTIELNEGENYVWTEEGTTTLTYMAKAAQRVLAMNRTLQKNLNAIELKKGGDVK